MNDLVEIEEKTILEAFSSKEGLGPIIQQVKDVVSNFEPDLRTGQSRAEITSLASKVSKFKGKVDDLGKDLVSEWKAKSKVVDNTRKNFRDQLDAVKVIARKPLTDWEADQEAREAAEEAEQARIEQERVDQELAENLRKQFEQDHEMALLLDDKYDREAAAEADRIEQERVVAEKKTEEERISREAHAQAAGQERERIRLENVKRDRVQAQNNKMLVFTNYKTHSLENIDIPTFESLLKEIRLMKITEEDWDSDFITEASLAQSRAIIGIQEAMDRRKKYELDQSKLKSLEEEKAETLRKEEVERQQQIITDRETAEAKKKADNRNHQRAINVGIVKAMVDLGASEEVAQSIVESIAKKNIPNISIAY